MNQDFRNFLKTNIIVTNIAGPKTSNKTRRLLINKPSEFKEPKIFKKIDNKVEIDQIKKIFKFSLLNKIFQVHDYVLSYKKKITFYGLR